MSDKIIFESTPNGKLNSFYRSLLDNMEICGAKDSGMNRGDIIERDGNIIHVRFKTAGVTNV